MSKKRLFFRLGRHPDRENTILNWSWKSYYKIPPELFSRRRLTTGSAQQSSSNVGNHSMHVLHNILGSNINTTAFWLCRSSLHLLPLKSSMAGGIISWSRSVHLANVVVAGTLISGGLLWLWYRGNVLAFKSHDREFEFRFDFQKQNINIWQFFEPNLAKNTIYQISLPRPR